jgi:rubrerythrin
VPDLQIVDALADEKLSGDMSIQDMLIFAAKKEAQAVALYESLARLAGGSGHDRVFLLLAGQEREHKLKLEAEYEKHILQEN